MPKHLWAAWLKIRKAKSNTPTALALAISKLETWMLLGMSPKDVLEQSVMNGWIGLFPLKPGGMAGGNRQTALEACNQSVSEKWLKSSNEEDDGEGERQAKVH